MDTATIPKNDHAKLLQQNLLAKHLAGSRAYGTSVPGSDVDYRGIFYGDPQHICTPFYPLREIVEEEEEDTKFYELGHFLKLCLACNPNILETLWVCEEDIVYSTPAFEHLRAHRELFLSQKIAQTTTGYALSQLRRIRGHNRWLQNPQPVEAPQQIDFVTLLCSFEPTSPTPFDLRHFREGWRLVSLGDTVLGLFEASGEGTFVDADGSLVVDKPFDEEPSSTPKALLRFHKEQYKRSRSNWKHYWEWKKKRNQKRSLLEEQYGYDTKHAMHLVRLLRMGREALRDGVIRVKRPDAQELLAIRSGAWSYEELLAYATQLEAEVKGKWLQHTELPAAPDTRAAANLLVELRAQLWSTSLHT